jgi:hypothetical protein
MSTGTSEILTELREMRAEFTEARLEQAERMACLETQMKSLVGNGQPGRIDRMEKVIGGLLRFRYTVVGYAAAAGTAVSLIIAWIHKK